jgi:hypothetical protein
MGHGISLRRHKDSYEWISQRGMQCGAKIRCILGNQSRIAVAVALAYPAQLSTTKSSLDQVSIDKGSNHPLERVLMHGYS